MSTRTAVARVLILESCALWRKHAQRLLAESPLDVTFVRTTQRAIGLLSRESFDVLVVGDCVSVAEGKAPAEIPAGIRAFVEIGSNSHSLPIVACSHISTYLAQLRKSGCTHETIRSHLRACLFEILGLSE